MKTYDHSGHGGFTLVEVLAAIMVFTFGVLALYRLEAASVQNNSFSGQLTQAVTLAQDRLEKLMALSDTIASPNALLVDTQNDGVTGLDNHNTVNSGGVLTADHVDNTRTPFTVYWNVVTNNPITNTRRLQVIVTWPNTAARNNPHTVILECVKPDIV